MKWRGKRPNRRLPVKQPGGLRRVLRRGVVLMLSLGGLTGVGWLGKWMLNPATFPVDNVAIHGVPQYLDQEALQETISHHTQNGFLLLRVDRLRDALEAKPWIYRASVRRIWPATVKVNLVEQQPLARWATGGLVNRDGELFGAATQEQYQGLPLFQGPADTQGMMARRYSAFGRHLGPLGHVIRTLGLDGRYAWQAHLASGLVLELGRDDVEQRLARFVRTYHATLAAEPRSARRVDLRYANGFAVHYAPPESAAISLKPEVPESGNGEKV